MAETQDVTMLFVHMSNRSLAETTSSSQQMSSSMRRNFQTSDESSSSSNESSHFQMAVNSMACRVDTARRSMLGDSWWISA
ncbi:hypothetical protein CLOM_g12638 [Closterium sp. NIES-68]|nr:hypothetical protein CLOM_g12638 [Closterium sp. NIES-68]GJP68586.1 hypothetical protein CLOP_g25266 [Closterium sp. NIES-67]